MTQPSKRYVARIDDSVDIGDMIVSIEQNSGTVVESHQKEGTIVFDAGYDEADVIRELSGITSVTEQEEQDEPSEDEAEPEFGSNESFSVARRRG